MKLLDGFFSFIARPFPTPWTGNAAFSQNTTFPFHDVRGRGRYFSGNLNLTAPQVLTTNVVKPEGFGGLFAGQYVVQPLSEPPQGSA